MDAITGAPWMLLLAAALVSAALLLVPPDRDDAANTQPGDRPPLLRGRTILGISAVAMLAIGASKMLERERVGANDPKLLQVLEARARIHPTHEPTLYQLGNTYLANGDYKKATSPLEQAVALNPHDGWAQNDLGLALGMQRQFFAAISHLREAFRLIPDDQRPGRNLAWALRYARQPGAAESVYRAMQPRWPADAELVALAGYMHFEDGGRKEGAAEVHRAFAMNSSDLVVRLMMAKVLTTQAKFTEAIPHFEAYLAAYPKDMENLAQYAMACALNGDNAKAMRTWDRIEKAAPGVIDQFPPWRDSRDAARAQLAAGPH
jgi:Flp pilus assembly protein TadD